MALTILMIALYLAALLSALMMRRREIKARWLFLLRGMVPNWRFYQALGLAPRLYRRHQTNGSWSNWRPLPSHRQRRWRDLFFNPAGNLLLAQQSLIDHLANQVAETDDDDDAICSSLVYRMVERLVRQSYDGTAGLDPVQFCLCLETPGDPVDIDRDVVLMSPCLAL